MTLIRVHGEESEKQWLRCVSDNQLAAAAFRMVHTSDGRRFFSYASRGFGRMLGIPRRELLLDAGLFYALLPVHEVAGFTQLESFAASAMQPFLYEARVQLPNLSTKWLHWHAHPSRPGDGNLVWDGVCIDVSFRIRCDTWARAAQDLIPLCPACKKIRDDQGRWRDADPEMYKTFGLRDHFCPTCLLKLCGDNALNRR